MSESDAKVRYIYGNIPRKVVLVKRREGGKQEERGWLGIDQYFLEGRHSEEPNRFKNHSSFLPSFVPHLTTLTESYRPIFFLFFSPFLPCPCCSDGKKRGREGDDIAYFLSCPFFIFPVPPPTSSARKVDSPFSSSYI